MKKLLLVLCTICVLFGGFSIKACRNKRIQELTLITDARLLRSFLSKKQNSYVNKKDSNGSTLLHKAAEQGRSDLVSVLLECGADVDARNNEEETPLFVVADSILHSHGKQEEYTKLVAQVLIKSGADVNASNTYGETPLHAAAFAKNKSVIKVLAQSGADVNAQSSSSQLTPLHKVIRSCVNFDDEGNAVNVIRELLKNGASIDIKDDNNQTPYEIADDFYKKVIDNYFDYPQSRESDIANMFDYCN